MEDAASVKLELDTKETAFDSPITGSIIVKANKSIDVSELSIGLIEEKWTRNTLSDRNRGGSLYKYRRGFDKKYKLAGEKKIAAGKTVRYKFKLGSPRELISKEVPNFLKPMLNLVNKEFIEQVKPYTNPREDPNWFLVAILNIKPDSEIFDQTKLKLTLR